MNRQVAWLVAVIVVVASAGRAWAQEDAPQPAPSAWSLYSGHTVGSGDALGVGVGWPGINVDFLHAAGTRLDVGARFTFNYGTEVTFSVIPAVNLHFLLRFALLDKGLFRMALQVEPGLGFFFATGGGLILHLPAALQMSLHPVRSLAVLLGVELRPQILVAFGGGAGFSMPLLFVNPGVEYALTDSLSLNLRIGLGPGVVSSALGTGVGFSFRTLVGASFKW